MPTINTTPLIDVLLVLLVLLIITLPRSTHHVSLDLPGIPATQVPPPVTQIEIDFDGHVFWDGTAVRDDDRLEHRFRAAAQTSHLVRITPDRHARYERVAQVLAAAQRAHVARLALTPVGD